MNAQAGENRELIEEISALKRRIGELEQQMTDRTEELVRVNEELRNDITERKRVEDDLRKSEERFRSLYNNTPVMLHSIDSNGSLVNVSEYWLNTLGYARDEVIGRKSSEFLTEASRKYAVEAVLPKFLKQGYCNNIEYRFVKKNGEVIDTLLSAISERDQNGMVTRSFAVVTDITGLKLAQEALRQTEENYRHSLDHFPMGVRIVSNEGETMYANRAFLDMYGYDNIDELITTPVFKRYTPESFAEYMIRREKRKRGDDIPSEYEISIVRKDDEIRHLLVFRKEILWNGEKLFQVIYQDITDRKRAEEALRDSEVRFRTLSEKTPMGMSLIGGQGRYEYVNPAFVKIFGYDLYDIPSGRDWFTMAYPDPEYRKEVMAVWKDDFCNSPNLETRPRIYDVTCKGGALRTILFRSVTLPSGKQLIIYEDITDRKKAEKNLEDTLFSLRKAVGATIQVMVSAVESRDPYTAGHQTRSADLARAIALEMGLPHDKIEAIRMAGSIHDIGKLSIPAEILSKPIKLSDIEFSLIKEHAHKGSDMLKDVQSPWPLLEIVYQHHERVDGSGYPRNLQGEEILIEARILSVADVVEAMASHRPYRPGLGIDAALEEIEKNRGVFYDSAVADACLRLFREKGFRLEGLAYEQASARSTH